MSAILLSPLILSGLPGPRVLSVPAPLGPPIESRGPTLVVPGPITVEAP